VSAHDDTRWHDDLAAYLLGALDERERSDLEAHLADCDRCRAEARWLQPAVDVLPAAVEQLNPPPRLRDRVLGEIEADGGAPSGAHVSDGRRSLRRRLALRPALTGLAAVVALAAGIATGYALRGDDEPTAQTTTVPVQGTAPAIRATGTVVQHDDDWTLDVDRLPELRAGDVYQVWMRKDKTLIPSVVFVPSGARHATVALPSRMARADELLVTREPSGGSQAPTSAPLLSATLQ
jgi:anti-sigma-K factor RskA